MPDTLYIVALDARTAISTASTHSIGTSRVWSRGVALPESRQRRPAAPTALRLHPGLSACHRRVAAPVSQASPQVIGTAYPIRCSFLPVRLNCLRGKGKWPAGLNLTFNNCSAHSSRSTLQPLSGGNEPLRIAHLLRSTRTTLHHAQTEVSRFSRSVGSVGCGVWQGGVSGWCGRLGL